MPEPDMSIWTGRVDTADGADALRWHQMVKPLSPNAEPGIVLIGFACDEGVRRNGGRVGAKDGPRAIRTALANLAWHQSSPIYDAGDVRCDDADMEDTQARLAEVVAEAIRAGHRPLVLGGGHEAAWGTFQGIVAAKPEEPVGVINIDSHFDLRGDRIPTSGTPFAQIAAWCREHKKRFRYLCAGVSRPANTFALFEKARILGTQWIEDTGCDMLLGDLSNNWADDLASTVDRIHLSVDLDVLPAATMPAVSAPAARGVSLDVVTEMINHVVDLQKVVAVDVVECNPSLDGDGRGARVAAYLVWQIAFWWSGTAERRADNDSIPF